MLADDDVLLRESLASLLDRSGLEVVGQAGDAAELMDLVGRERPDLAVVDIRMPPKFSTEGLEAARVIQRDFPKTAVMVLSAHVEIEHAMDLLANGQRTGYLLKSRVTDITDFVDALKRVERGGSAIDPALVQELVAARRDGDRLGPLTAREREVLALMAEGRSNAGIGQALWVTEGTIEKHVRNILIKLQLPEAAEVHRRVLAVLAFLEADLRSDSAGCNVSPGARWQNIRVQLRCVIVDDDEGFRQAARTMLERGGMTVAGVAGSGAEAVEQVRRLRPDVVLIDIRLGEDLGSRRPGSWPAAAGLRR